jgi:asparagine synthase (glutamine-hydrolysing)
VQGQSAARALAYVALTATPRRVRATMRQLRWGSLAVGRGAPASELETAPTSTLHEALADALVVSSLPSLLRYADRSSMAHSVEVRLPFLDHRIVAFAFGLRSDLLVGEGSTKRVLRASLRSKLPQLADQPGKLGFTAPENEWIRGPLRDWIGELVRAADQRGIYPKGSAATTWNAVLRGKAPAQVAWRLAVGELWVRRYVDDGGRPPE